MEITIYRYKIVGANWSEEIITKEKMQTISKALNDQPFYGDIPENKYGFAQCINIENKIIGVFVQKFPTLLIDYDSETKAEIKNDTVDCGEYLFILDFFNYELFLQAHRSTGLPGKEEINHRFIALLKYILTAKTNMFFLGIEPTIDEVNRDKIVEIFYKISEKVIEVEFEDFDVNIIEDQKRLRNGKRQTYFNPIEEYQEAMEAGAIKLSHHADKAYIKAKKGESLKKDPITRAMLEASNKPVKITFVKEGETITEYGVNKSKEKIIIEGDNFNLVKQAEDIYKIIFGGKVKKSVKSKESNQGRLEL